MSTSPSPPAEQPGVRDFSASEDTSSEPASFEDGWRALWRAIFRDRGRDIDRANAAARRLAKAR